MFTVFILGKALKMKYQAAVKGKETTRVAFEGLDESISEDNRNKWLKEEAEAMEKRGEYLKIYQVQIDKGKSDDLYRLLHELIKS
jgi:hypothetical protein